MNCCRTSAGNLVAHDSNSSKLCAFRSKQPKQFEVTKNGKIATRRLLRTFVERRR
jgi:hypothetical protein